MEKKNAKKKTKEVLEWLQELSLDNQKLNREVMVALEALERAYKPRVVRGPASPWDAINMKEWDDEEAAA